MQPCKGSDQDGDEGSDAGKGSSVALHVHVLEKMTRVLRCF